LTHGGGHGSGFGGELQAEVMAVVWRLGEATVDEVRSQQLAARRPAYNTVQTVLNRLVAHGLLKRERHGRAFRYTPTTSEDEYLVQVVRDLLVHASPVARRQALQDLLVELHADEVSGAGGWEDGE
jgi:predicted transcriptional regulator